MYQILVSFSSLWVAVTLCTYMHCQYNERVHRKEQHTSEIKNSDFIDIGNFEVGYTFATNVFTKLDSLL